MKIIAKPKHSPYGIEYAFKNKKELQDFVERRKKATGENININSCIYDLLEYCNLELIKKEIKNEKKELSEL